MNAIQLRVPIRHLREFDQSANHRSNYPISTAPILSADEYRISPNLFATIQSLRNQCPSVIKLYFLIFHHVMTGQKTAETAESNRTRRLLLRRTDLVAAGIPAMLAT